MIFQLIISCVAFLLSISGFSYWLNNAPCIPFKEICSKPEIVGYYLPLFGCVAVAGIAMAVIYSQFRTVVM